MLTIGDIKDKLQSMDNRISLHQDGVDRYHVNYWIFDGGNHPDIILKKINEEWVITDEGNLNQRYFNHVNTIKQSMFSLFENERGINVTLSPNEAMIHHLDGNVYLALRVFISTIFIMDAVLEELEASEPVFMAS